MMMAENAAFIRSKLSSIEIRTHLNKGSVVGASLPRTLATIA
jgi:hypothetical protein